MDSAENDNFEKDQTEIKVRNIDNNENTENEIITKDSSENKTLDNHFPALEYEENTNLEHQFSMLDCVKNAKLDLLEKLKPRNDEDIEKLQSPDGINGLYAPTFQLGADIEDTANINDVEDYLEQLYESTDDKIVRTIEEKIRATGLILQLARNPDNLEELFENETVVGALARVLREDWKKSTELATNIIYVFFCFSSFTQFHGVIAHFKIGSLTIQIVEHELKKYDMWKSELDAKKESMKKFTSSQKKEFDKNMLQVSCLILKQEQLLRVSFYMLLNLSENIETEQKMCSKGIVNMLMESLKRDNFELIILVVSFLKKLSVFSDNVNIMKEKGIVELLAPQIPCKHDDQLNITLRLLLNLSFEEQLREKMVKQLLLPKLVSILSKDKHVLIVLCILYHLSLDDKSKSLFTYTECIPVIMRMLLTSPLTTAIPTRSAQYDSEDEHDVDLMGGVGGGGGADFKHSRRAGDLRDGSSTTAVNPPVDLELIALAVNLAANKQCAELICGQDGEGLKLLMKRAFKYKDALYLKVIRNIAKHDGDMKMHFINYLSDLSLVLKDDVFSFNEFTLECIGILSQITIKDIDYELLLKEYGLVEWISEKLDPKSNTPDDFLLEIIVLVGTVCNDDSCAQLLSATQIIQHLIRLLNDFSKQRKAKHVKEIKLSFDAYKKKLQSKNNKDNENSNDANKDDDATCNPEQEADVKSTSETVIIPETKTEADADVIKNSNLSEPEITSQKESNDEQKSSNCEIVPIADSIEETSSWKSSLDSNVELDCDKNSEKVSIAASNSSTSIHTKSKVEETNNGITTSPEIVKPKCKYEDRYAGRYDGISDSEISYSDSEDDKISEVSKKLKPCHSGESDYDSDDDDDDDDSYNYSSLCSEDENSKDVEYLKTKTIQDFYEICKYSRQEDDEMVLQIVYVFHQMIFHPSTRHVIVGATEAPAYLIDLMHDKNKHVRSVCDSTLDIIAEYDEEWAKKILVEKFRWHNSQWLEMVESQDGRQGDFLEPVYDAAGQPMITDDDESPFSPIYLHDPTVLDRSDMFYGGLSDDTDSTDFDFSDVDDDSDDELSENRMNPDNFHKIPEYYSDEYNTEAEMNEEFLSDPMMKAQYEYAAASAAQVQSGYDAHEDDRQYD